MILKNDDDVEDERQKQQYSRLTSMKDVFHEQECGYRPVLSHLVQHQTKDLFQQIGVEHNDQKRSDNTKNDHGKEWRPILRQEELEVYPYSDHTGDYRDCQNVYFVDQAHRQHLDRLQR